MQVSGNAMVFRNEHDGASGKFYTYVVGVSGKKMDGSFVNTTIDAKFKKGVVLENKTKINITEGFVSAREFTSRNGDTVRKPEVVILDFEVNQDQSGFTALTDDDVPF